MKVQAVHWVCQLVPRSWKAINRKAEHNMRFCGLKEYQPVEDLDMGNPVLINFQGKTDTFLKDFPDPQNPSIQRLRDYIIMWNILH